MSIPSPAPVPETADFRAWMVYLVKELGLTTALVAFICYLLSVQLPQMQADFRMQTDKLVEAVSNNNRAMGELAAEIRAIRQEREGR